MLVNTANIVSFLICVCAAINLQIFILILLYLDLPRDDPVEVDGWRGWRPALALGQPLLLGLPLLEAAGDVDGDATAPKVSPADVAGDGHADC